MDTELPGTPSHQRILRCLIDLFDQDAAIRAFGMFGSLVRGDWDVYSDLDLDVVMAETTASQVGRHIANMKDRLATAGYETFLCFEESPNGWVFILDTLDRISIRFHTLEETSPNIIDSLTVLTGELSVDDLAAASVREPRYTADIARSHHKFLEHAIYVPIYLHRGETMNAYTMLTTLRNALLTIYCATHGIPKVEKFEKEAPAVLRERLLPTFALLDAHDIRRACTCLLKLYEESIGDISAGKLELTAQERTILDKARTY